MIPGCEVTVGSNQDEGGKWPYAETAGAIGSMDSTHVTKDVTVSLEMFDANPPPPSRPKAKKLWFCFAQLRMVHFKMMQNVMCTTLHLESHPPTHLALI